MSPKNLALGRPARQSSVYDDLGADIVLDGDTSSDGPRKCNCTQQDPQAWWEVDLGHMVHVYHVKVSQSRRCRRMKEKICIRLDWIR